MKFVLSISLATLLQSLALNEARSAVALLGKSKPSDADVHSTRKTCKRLRAWAVLLREPLGRSETDRIEERLRQAARGLSASRETAVRMQTLQAFAQRHADQADMISSVRSLLAQHDDEPEQPAESSHDLLLAAQHNIARLALPDLDPALLERALAATYRRARRAMHDVKAHDADSVHQWRKKLRRHTDQSQPLGDLWPGLKGKRHHRLKKLNDALGDHHDLADLGLALQRSDVSAEQRDIVLRLIESDQMKLLEHAQKLGATVFSLKPRHWSASTPLA
jgi:CHAD domain-containing protein